MSIDEDDMDFYGDLQGAHDWDAHSERQLDGELDILVSKVLKGAV